MPTGIKPQQPTLLLTAVLSMALAGCASTPDPIVGASVIQPQSEFGQADYSYKLPDRYLLRPADRISINVFREPDFSMESVQIGVDGSISLPLVGTIPASGMTPKQFEEDVTRRLSSAGLKSPIVSINVSEYASHLVTVEGQVSSPGVYSFQPGARLSSAIALASGPTRSANVSQVAVFRESSDGIMVAKFDYQQVSQGTMLDPVLQPRDRVVVGTDGLSVFWQDFLRTVPAFGLFANAAR